MTGVLRRFWRSYLYDFGRIWKVFPLVYVSSFVWFWEILADRPAGEFQVIATAALIWTMILYPLAALPGLLFRSIVLSTTFALPLMSAGHLAVELIADSEHSAILISAAVVFLPLGLGLMIKVPVVLRGRRMLRPANALIFGSDDPREEIFNRIRPAAGLAFPDPMFLPSELLEKENLYRAPVREDAGKAVHEQRVRILASQYPESLHLRIETRQGKKPLHIDQRWQFDTLENGAIQVSVRQRMRMGLLTWVLLAVQDSVGDWLEAVMTWIAGEEMRSGYGRSVNRRIARAEVRKAPA